VRLDLEPEPELVQGGESSAMSVPPTLQVLHTLSSGP
jgi:hypothetical protein